jgi:hypothetical protein
MHCLLLGNGLNRLQSSLDWVGLLQRLGSESGVPEFTENVEQRPLSLLFEALCAFRGGRFRRAETAIKGKIATLLSDVTPGPIHRRFLEPFDVVLTTNYDYAIEHAAEGAPLMQRVSDLPESRYSLFRRNRVGKSEIWHIHGDQHYPETILLGFDHYAGYLQKIRNYLTDGIPSDTSKVPIRSPLKAGVVDFEKRGWRHSWVDHFLRDHLHIVGLGFDFTEIDLWWLLLHKRRRKNQTGHTFYYSIKVSDHEDALMASRCSVLRSLGVHVTPVVADDYTSGYECVLEGMLQNIKEHPSLLGGSKVNFEGINSPGGNDNEPASGVEDAMQMRLKFRRGSQKRKVKG